MHYGQFCPVAKASEMIAERWTPLVIAELLAGTPASTISAAAYP